MSQGRYPSFILASASPRRRDLLTRAGYRFEVVISDIDESVFAAEGVSADEYARLLALAKARSVAERHINSLVVGADTVADFQGQIIGKPSDAEQARQITVRLFSSPHRIITGVAIVRLCDGIELCRSDSTTVYPRKLTDNQLAEHIEGGTWRDKAGAYAIQEDGDEFVERIEGSLTNVMGMPMELFARMLGEIRGT
ncbi:MAG: septum formation protein Maf [Sedimentisphaerales bacterium]|nr:septum formation protein Maf [Sedimentisphaerales bacterium]